MIAAQQELAQGPDDSELICRPRGTIAGRDALERDLAAARQRKSKLAEDEYLALIEPILIELARLYESAAATKEQP